MQLFDGGLTNCREATVTASSSASDDFFFCYGTPNAKFNDIATWQNGTMTSTLTAFAGVQYAAAGLVMYDFGSQGQSSNSATTPSQTNKSSNSGSGHVGTLSVGAAAALFVVLGVCVIAGITALLWYLKRRKRRQHTAALAKVQGTNDAWDKAELHGNDKSHPEMDGIQRLELDGRHVGTYYKVQELDTGTVVQELETPLQPAELCANGAERRFAS